MSLTGNGSRRRRFVAAALAGAFAISVAVPPPAVAQDLSGDIRFTWWGATSRNQKTEDIANLFEEANPGVTIAREPGEFNTYWDKLTVQSASGNQPCSITMQSRWLAQYADPAILAPARRHGRGRHARRDRGRPDRARLRPRPGRQPLLHPARGVLLRDDDEPDGDRGGRDDHSARGLDLGRLRGLRARAGRQAARGHLRGRQPRLRDGRLHQLRPGPRRVAVQRRRHRRCLGADNRRLLHLLGRARGRKASPSPPTSCPRSPTTSSTTPCSPTAGSSSTPVRPTSSTPARKILDVAKPGETFVLHRYPVGPAGRGDDIGSNGLAIGANCDENQVAIAAAWANFFLQDEQRGRHLPLRQRRRHRRQLPRTTARQSRGHPGPAAADRGVQRGRARSALGVLPRRRLCGHSRGARPRPTRRRAAHAAAFLAASGA